MTPSELRQHFRLATYIAKRQRSAYVDFDDLIQVAQIALWRSSLTYDPALGSFARYGGRPALHECVRLKRPLRRMGRFTLPKGQGGRTDASGLQRAAYRLRDAERDIPKRHYRGATYAETMAGYDLEPVDAALLYAYVLGSDESLDDFDDAEDMPDPLTVAATQEDSVENGAWRELIARHRDGFDAREALIYELRWLEGATLDEVGEKLGVSRERVRQLETRMRERILREGEKRRLSPPTSLC